MYKVTVELVLSVIVLSSTVMCCQAAKLNSVVDKVAGLTLLVEIAKINSHHRIN